MNIETNRQRVKKVLTNGTTKEIYSSDVLVGDILLIVED